jgi:hypothetical protein
MIQGMHILITGKEAQANQAFLRDKLGLSSFDAGGGFTIFTLPEVEVACHEGDQTLYDISFYCDDLPATIKELQAKGVECSPVREEMWGSLTDVKLPDGRAVLLYQRKYK